MTEHWTSNMCTIKLLYILEPVLNNPISSKACGIGKTHARITSSKDYTQKQFYIIQQSTCMNQHISLVPSPSWVKPPFKYCLGFHSSPFIWPEKCYTVTQKPHLGLILRINPKETSILFSFLSGNKWRTGLQRRRPPKEHFGAFKLYHSTTAPCVNQHPQWYGVKNPKFGYQQDFIFWKLKFWQPTGTYYT